MTPIQIFEGSRTKPERLAKKHELAGQAKLLPRDDRGREILDELEARTGQHPYRSVPATGERTYYLDSMTADVTGFDPMLRRIAPDWREHLSRTR